MEMSVGAGSGEGTAPKQWGGEKSDLLVQSQL